MSLKTSNRFQDNRKVNKLWNRICFAASTCHPSFFFFALRSWDLAFGRGLKSFFRFLAPQKSIFRLEAQDSWIHRMKRVSGMRPVRNTTIVRWTSRHKLCSKFNWEREKTRETTFNSRKKKARGCCHLPATGRHTRWVLNRRQHLTGDNVVEISRQ